MRRSNTAVAVLVAAAATGAALVAPAMLNVAPEFMVGAQNGDGVSKANRQQALNVVRAWHMNGPYSECMAERGHDVPWRFAIHLAPGLADNPAFVELEKELSISEGDEDPLWATEEFDIASHRCRSVHSPTDREWMTDDGDVDDWDAVLAEAREYGWSPDDPFALDEDSSRSSQ